MLTPTFQNDGAPMMTRILCASNLEQPRQRGELLKIIVTLYRLYIYYYEPYEYSSQVASFHINGIWRRSRSGIWCRLNRYCLSVGVGLELGLAERRSRGSLSDRSLSVVGECCCQGTVSILADSIGFKAAWSHPGGPNLGALLYLKAYSPSSRVHLNVTPAQCTMKEQCARQSSRTHSWLPNTAIRCGILNGSVAVSHLLTRLRFVGISR